MICMRCRQSPTNGDIIKYLNEDYCICDNCLFKPITQKSKTGLIGLLTEREKHEPAKELPGSRNKSKG